jgi:hypothetical protein
MVNRVRDLVGMSPGVTEQQIAADVAMVLTRVDLKMLLLELLQEKQITAQVPPISKHRTLFGQFAAYALRPISNIGDCLASGGLVYFPVARHVVGRGWDEADDN